MSRGRALPRLIGLSPGTARGPGRPGDLEELERRVLDALRGGLPGVLLREPAVDDGPLERLAARLRARAPELWIGLHDRPHLVAATGADAVHLGFRSLTPSELRGWLGAEVLVGLSTHADDDERAWAGADYLFHGPVHATRKPAALEPIGPEGLARAVRRASVPVLALGGVTPERTAALVAAGAHGVAVRGDLLGADDPAGRARAHLRALDEALRAGPA